jgi:hypothetical protein
VIIQPPANTPEDNTKEKSKTFQTGIIRSLLATAAGLTRTPDDKQLAAEKLDIFQSQITASSDLILVDNLWRLANNITNTRKFPFASHHIVMGPLVRAEDAHDRACLAVTIDEIKRRVDTHTAENHPAFEAILQNIQPHMQKPGWRFRHLDSIAWDVCCQITRDADDNFNITRPRSSTPAAPRSATSVPTAP